jgi:hypothetical protein
MANEMLMQSYSEANQNSTYLLASGAGTNVGEVVFGKGYNITKAVYYIRKGGSGALPTGNAVVSIYAITGTVGANGKHTGSALATSDNFDVSTLPATPTFALTTFTFSGANQLDLQVGVGYALVIVYTGGDVNNRLEIGYNSATLGIWDGNSESSGSTLVGDLCFYFYGIPYLSKPAPINKLRPSIFSPGRAR